MINNILLKDGIHSLEINIILEDLFKISLKIVEDKKSVVFFKPNNANIHLTIFQENNEYKSHISKEGKINDLISHSEVVAPFNDVKANYLDYKQYFENVKGDLRFVNPREQLYCIDFNQILVDILSYMISNELFSIEQKQSSKGDNIIITYNISNSLINQTYEIMERYLLKIKAKKILKILRKQKEFNYYIITEDGQYVIHIDNCLYANAKNPITEDLKNNNFRYYNFFEKIFHIFYKNLPGIQFDPIIKSVRKYLSELYKMNSLNDFCVFNM